MLGTRVEARWSMGSSLRQVRVCSYRHAGSGAHPIYLGNSYIDLILPGFRFPSLSRNVAGGSMARSSLRYTVRSSSITYIALRTAFGANFGYTSSLSTRPSISSSLGLPLCVFVMRSAFSYSLCLRMVRAISSSHSLS
jgi:hypothetical protein